MRVVANHARTTPRPGLNFTTPLSPPDTTEFKPSLPPWEKNIEENWRNTNPDFRIEAIENVDVIVLRSAPITKKREGELHSASLA